MTPAVNQPVNPGFSRLTVFTSDSHLHSYVSCVLGCPYEGKVAPEKVAHVSPPFVTVMQAASSASGHCSQIRKVEEAVMGLKHLGIQLNSSVAPEEHSGGEDRPKLPGFAPQLLRASPRRRLDDAGRCSSPR